MNCKMIARSISFVLLSGFLALNLIVISSQPVRASEGEGGGNCKWMQQTCPDNTFREICLVDGNGNSCTCGAVTRHCN